MELIGENLVYRFEGRTHPALDGVSLRFRPGERIAMMGRNGSGKTTLLLHLNGVLKPQQGRVYLADNGSPAGSDRRETLRRQVGIVFQNPDDQLFSASVAQDISFGPLNLKLGREAARGRVQAAAQLCRVAHLLERPVHALSAGEKARVALAGVLAMEPSFVIVDETVSSLDPWIRLEVLNLFDRLADEGKTVIMVTHDVHMAGTWAERLIVMQAGRVAFDGGVAEGIERTGMNVNRKERV